jgi:hypothetical protein
LQFLQRFCAEGVAQVRQKWAVWTNRGPRSEWQRTLKAGGGLPKGIWVICLLNACQSI